MSIEKIVVIFVNLYGHVFIRITHITPRFHLGPLTKTMVISAVVKYRDHSNPPTSVLNLIVLANTALGNVGV